MIFKIDNYEYVYTKIRIGLSGSKARKGPYSVYANFLPVTSRMVSVDGTSQTSRQWPMVGLKTTIIKCASIVPERDYADGVNS